MLSQLELEAAIRLVIYIRCVNFGADKSCQSGALHVSYKQ